MELLNLYLSYKFGILFIQLICYFMTVKVLKNHWVYRNSLECYEALFLLVNTAILISGSFRTLC